MSYPSSNGTYHLIRANRLFGCTTPIHFSCLGTRRKLLGALNLITRWKVGRGEGTTSTSTFLVTSHLSRAGNWTNLATRQPYRYYFVSETSNLGFAFHSLSADSHG